MIIAMLAAAAGNAQSGPNVVKVACHAATGNPNVAACSDNGVFTTTGPGMLSCKKNECMIEVWAEVGYPPKIVTIDSPPCGPYIRPDRTSEENNNYGVCENLIIEIPERE